MDVARSCVSLGRTPRVITYEGQIVVEPKYGWAIGDGSLLLRDSLTFGWDTYSRRGREWIGLPPGLRRPDRNDMDHVPKAISVLSPWPENYYHFVTDVLPKFVLLDRSGVLTDDVPILVAEQLYTSKFFRGAMGRGRLRTLDLSPLRQHTMTCELTVAHSSPLDAEMAASLRDLLEIADDIAPRDGLVFVTRNANRGRVPVNISAVERAFADHGFRVVDLDGLSFNEQIHIFRSASVVGAIHGASLANLTWCDPRWTRVVELVPRVDGTEFDCFQTMCHAFGIEYSRVLGDDKAYAHKRAPFSVPIADLSVAIRNVLAR
jgi:capsular polysaccharide biosynthesis protein